MKIFAYYLPQYHRVEENDKWWGKGFTEWTNVKKAKPLFNGHKQPKVPLNNNYYDLTNINTLKWQSSLMKKYDINGLIFYHYYFKGKKILEKPAENLRKNEEINIDYFFCWANHSWYKSWNGSKELLLEQTYGDKQDWNEHFEYLLPFFKDKRYQKKNNKPIFMVFRSNFEKKNEIFDFFDKKCKENGFDGICIIETLESYDFNNIKKFKANTSKQTEYIHLREPGSVTILYKHLLRNQIFRSINKIKRILNKFLKLKLIEQYDGNKFFKLLIKNKIKDNEIIRGLFCEWDNTPRHEERGYVITPPSKENFLKYLNSIKDNEFLFVNAWNEWCEGMMLEPTEENKYKYLEWIKEWKDENWFNGI